MKKTISLLMAILLMIVMICGCSDKESNQNNASEPSQETTGNSGNDSSQKTTNTSDSSKKTEVDLSAYKTPAETVKVELSKEDPSNEDINFIYDAEGKVTQCYYKIDGQQVYVNYTYKDGYVQIYAFEDDVLVADETISISDYNPEKGFTSINGYYIKGVSERQHGQLNIQMVGTTKCFEKI